MNFIDAVEYSLLLRTGEVIQFSELDESTIDVLQDPVSLQILSGILDRCTKVSHSIMQDAKRGDTKELEKSLKTPPIGALLKLDKPICSEIHHCSMADGKKCTTKNVKGKEGLFPVCWEYSMENATLAARDLSRCIVHAWRMGRYVVIIQSG